MLCGKLFLSRERGCVLEPHLTLSNLQGSLSISLDLLRPTVKPIPHQLRSNYDSLLKKGVPAREHSYYRKWLRYYLDYCQKNGLDESDKGSLSHFIKKLK
jgi:hypothetical protein